MTGSESLEARGSERPFTCLQSTRSFSTADVVDTQRFAFFCDGICDTFVGISPQKFDEAPFEARFSAFNAGPAALALMTATGHRARRDAAMMRRRADDSIYVNHMRAGQCLVDHGGRRAIQRAGRSILLDSSQPFALEFPERSFELLSLRPPKGLLGNTQAALPTGATLISVGNEGRILDDMMGLLSAMLRIGDGLPIERMIGTIIATVRQLAGLQISSPQGGRIAFGLLVDYVDANLSDPLLSSASIARAFGCTARTIQSRFDGHGKTASQWIVERRLERARAILESEEGSLLGVAAIAHRSGFLDASYFSRAFHTRFGMPPGRMRPRH